MEYSAYVQRLSYRHFCSVSLILYISKNTKLHLMCKTWSGDVGWSDDVGGLAHLPCWWVPLHASWLWRDSYAWCTVLSSDMLIHISIHRARTNNTHINITKTGTGDAACNMLWNIMHDQKGSFNTLQRFYILCLFACNDTLH